MTEKTLILRSFDDAEFGPTTLLVQQSGRFASRIFVKLGDRSFNAKSLMGMLTLGMTEGDRITVSAEGPDEEAAVEAIWEAFRR